MSALTINPNHSPVWRPVQDLARAHQLHVVEAPLLTLEDARAQVMLDNPPELADYRGYPKLQEEIAEELAHRRFAVEPTVQAARRLKGITKVTPLVMAHAVSEETGNDCLVKRDDLQEVGSFKIRGALNMIASLTDEQRERGVACTSAGNAALGLAYSAELFGVSGTVFMPKNTPTVKVEAVEKFGVQATLVGENFSQADAACQEWLEKQGATAPIYIPPFDHRLVTAGQGTIGKEIIEVAPDTDIVIMGSGGGGLLGGVAEYVKNINPNAVVYGVEPAGANSMQRSLQLGKLITLDLVETAAEGLAVARIGEHTFDLAQRYVDGIITVSEEEIFAAMGDMFRDIGVRAEASGAVGYAGIRKLNVTGKKIVTICTGSNISRETFDRLTA